MSAIFNSGVSVSNVGYNTLLIKVDADLEFPTSASGAKNIILGPNDAGNAHAMLESAIVNGLTIKVVGNNGMAKFEHYTWTSTGSRAFGFMVIGSTATDQKYAPISVGVSGGNGANALRFDVRLSTENAG